MYTEADQVKYKWRAEIILWAIIFILSLLLIIPVYYNTYQFPFMWHNVVFILVFLTFFRWIFFWKYTPYENTKWVIVAIISVQPLLLFILGRMFGDFRLYLDEYGLYPILLLHSVEDSIQWAKFIKIEIVASAILAIVSSIFLFFRLIYQLRRIYKSK